MINEISRGEGGSGGNEREISFIRKNKKIKQIEIFWKNRYLWQRAIRNIETFILKHKWHPEHRKCLFQSISGIWNIENAYLKA